MPRRNTARALVYQRQTCKTGSVFVVMNGQNRINEGKDYAFVDKIVR